MPPTALNPIIYQRDGITARLSDLPKFLALTGLAHPYGLGHPDRGPGRGMLSVGIPGLAGVAIANPQQLVERLGVALSMAADEPVSLRVAEPTGFLGAPFYRGGVGGFSIEVGESPPPIVNSAPISRSTGGSGMISVTFNFSAINGRNTSGWSEKYQFSDTDLSDASVMLRRYDNFITARLNMTAAGVRCTSIRFVDEIVGTPPANPGSRKVVVAQGPQPQFSAAGLAYYNRFMSSYATDFSGTKCLVRAQTAPVSGIIYKRSIWLGGLPDDFDTPTRQNMNAGPWTIAAAAWLFAFTPTLGLPSAVKIRDIDRGGQPLVLCSGVDVTGTIYAFGAAHGFTDGMVVNASGFRCSKGGCKPSGLYRVVVVDATHITLRNAAASARIASLGGFRKVVYLVNDIASITIPTFTQRKVGRPSDQSRGKSPRRLAVRA